MRSARLRWLPALVVPAVIAAGALVGTSQAGAAVNLPDRTAEQVLTLMAQADVRAMSGTLRQTSELGLPQLPDEGPQASGGGPATAVLDLLTGSHTARVYVDGPERLRAQVMDTLAERDLVRNGDDVWFYSSLENQAIHVSLPADHEVGDHDRLTLEAVPTPEELARRLLAAADASTDITVGPDTTVAGRSAYDLLVRPRTTDTLVGQISVAVDSRTGLPLRVSITARGQEAPAFEVAFTTLDLAAPDASLFRFVPPEGASVRELSPAARAPMHRAQPGPLSSTAPEPRVIGEGWDAVVELPAGTAPPQLTRSPLLMELTRAVPGGRLLRTALVTVLLTDDGRVLAGSVPAQRLQTLAATR